MAMTEAERRSSSLAEALLWGALIGTNLRIAFAAPWVPTAYVVLWVAWALMAAFETVRWVRALLRARLGDSRLAEFDGIVELADEFVKDLPAAERNEKSAASSNGNSVTQIPVASSEDSKRGRPTTGEAKSNAERQAAYRARHRGSSLQAGDGDDA